MSWRRAIVTLSLVAFGALSGGCAATGPMGLETGSLADKPRRVEPDAAITTALQCIRATGVLRHVVIGVGPWVDSTGKGNSVANGATGAFLPQAGTASFVTDTLRQMGASPLVMYFGAAERKVPARFVINGIFNSLDFGSVVDADLRVAGVGPTAQTGWAQLTLTIQMDAAATRLNKQTAVLVRSVRYSQFGASVGAVWGRDLVSGGVQVHDQQKLQFEAVNGPIATGVIDVVTREYPQLSKCRGALLASK